MKRILLSVTCLAGMSGFMVNSATAQTIIDVSGSAEAGRIEKRFEKLPEPKAELEIEIPEITEEVLGEEAAKIKFELTDMQIDGVTVFTDEELLPFYADIFGKEVTLVDLSKVAETLTAHYRNKGYILSRAIIPPQTVKGGVVHMKVIEGYIENVTVNGDTHGRDALFARWGEKIKASKPLNVNVLERYSLIANDLPGLSMTAQVKPSEKTPGAADLVLQVEHKAIDAVMSYDDRGTKTTGPEEGMINVSANSLMKLQEKTSLTFLNTADPRELHYFAASQDHILNSEGLKLSVSGSSVRSNPGHNLKELDFFSKSVSLSTKLSYPVIRSRRKNLNVSGAFSVKNSRSETFDIKLSEDRIRSVSLEGTYDFSDKFQGVNLANLGMHQGLSIFNATELETPDKTRERGRSDFTKFTALFSRTQQFTEKWSGYAAVTGQMSATQLLASEEFGYGGAQFGRGYDSSEITGDHGAAGLVEVRYTGQPEIPYLKFYQLYGFYDHGATWDISAVNQSQQRTGSSAGMGIRFGLTDYINGSVELAKPLTRPVAAKPGEEGNDPRVFLSLSAKY